MTLLKFSNQKGQGLIEILIVAVIILGCVIALMRFQSGLAYSDNMAQQQADATLLALSQLETLRDFQVINTQSPYSAYSNIASGSSVSVGPNTTYTLVWTVTTYTNPNYKLADITVSWADRYGTTQSIRLATKIAGLDPAYSATVMY